MVSPVPASFVALAERLADAAVVGVARPFRPRAATPDKGDGSPRTRAPRPQCGETLPINPVSEAAAESA